MIVIKFPETSKVVLMTALLLTLTTTLFSQSITIGEDGIVRCKDVTIGTTQNIFGEIYEVVDGNLLYQRRDEGKDLTKVCVSNVTNMNNLFRDSHFNQPIGNWDVSSVTNMESMFRNSSFNQPIGNWDVSNVSRMLTMFQNSQFNQPIDNWNVSNVTNMSRMFFRSQFNQPIGNWDLSNVTYIWGMFGYSQFNQPIGNWDVSKVTNLTSMFENSTFNYPIDNWDLSNVTNTSYMFSRSQFNQPIGNWNVSNVADMSYMFQSSPFNQPISNWDLSNVTATKYMFQNSQFNQPIDNWNVSNVTDMSYMFQGSLFNQPIDNWDVSNVINMGSMFSGSLYNHPIGYWDVSSVMNMSGMFSYSHFNQSINQWCVSNFSFEPFTFSSSSPLTQMNKPVWGTCPGLPPTPTLLSPHNDSLEVPWNVELSWNSDSLSTKYQLQIFEGFDPVVIDTLISDSTFVNSTSLKSSFTYNWRVRGINENLNRKGEWSSIWMFGTQKKPLQPPNQSTPFNGQENVGTQVEFQWSLIDSVVSYHLQISIDELFTNISFESKEIDTNVFVLPQTLEQNSSYFWRVRSLGDVESRHSSWSDTLSFTTGLRTTSEEDILPRNFSLQQNYPNPFNPTTQIQFSLPTSTHVRLEVYSLLGQRISTLVDGMMSVGNHTFTFEGNSLSSGVYIYRLTTSDFSQSRLMNLLK